MERYHADRVAAGGVLLLAGSLVGIGAVGVAVGAVLPRGTGPIAAVGLLLLAALLVLAGRSLVQGERKRD